MDIRETLESEINYHREQLRIHTTEIEQMEREVSKFPEVILQNKHNQMRISLEIIKGNKALINYVEFGII